jgi:hypothetical protein
MFVVGLDVTLFDAVTEYPYKRRENLDMVLQLMRCGTNNPYMSRATTIQHNSIASGITNHPYVCRENQ